MDTGERASRQVFQRPIRYWSWAIAIGSILTLFSVNFSSLGNPVKIAWGVLIQTQEWILLIPAFGLYLSAVIHNRNRSSAVDHLP